jgi:endonuclease YncB( thermonuclease family)
MKKALKIIPYLFLVLLFPSILSAGQFKVTRVYDGETLGVGGRGIELRVRLAGIDAPEISRSKRDSDQPYSRQAKRYLTGLVLNKTINVDRYGLDSDNRVLGVVYVGTKNVNLDLVKAGLAEVYRGKAPKGLDLGPYRQEENKARKAAKGMWSQGDKYISPKDWRKMNKRR